MTPHPEANPSLSPEPMGVPAERRSSRFDRPLAVLAWLVIVATFLVFVRAQNERREERMEGGGAGLRIAELQAKYMVGAANMTGSGPAAPGDAQPRDAAAAQQLVDAAGMINAGSVEQRLRYVVVVGELGGPRRMLEAAARLRAELPGDAGGESPRPAAGTAATLDALERVAATRALREASEPPTDAGISATSASPATSTATGPVVSSADAALLRKNLGWFGELALVPAASGESAERSAVLAPAKRLVVGAITLLVVAGIAATAGFAGLIVLLVLALLGTVRPRFRSGAARASVYAETFAVWFLLFLGFAATVGRLAALGPMGSSIVAMLGSLAALGWPVLRGIPFADVRRDIGLHTGRGVLREALAGVAAYAMTLPLLGIGILLMFALMWLGKRLGGAGSESPFSPSDAPSHPLIEFIAGNGPTGMFMAALLACVVAPLVEETMFRGVLYRHLRDATRRLGQWPSIVIAALVAAFIFAAIHPQGWVTVPALMSLACGFTLARESRDSLIPGMVAHGVNNGAIVGLLVLAFA
ncbi:MAG: CPBP family glutamic-type intramembrane protease [Phycisphaerales bacterium]